MNFLSKIKEFHDLETKEERTRDLMGRFNIISSAISRGILWPLLDLVFGSGMEVASMIEELSGLLYSN